MALRSLLLLLGFWFSVCLWGQEAILTQESDLDIPIVFQPHTLPAYANTNKIILQLAISMDENPRQVRIDVKSRETLQVTASPMQGPEVIIRMTGVRAVQTPAYRNFRLEKVLAPDRISCRLNLIDLPDSNVLRSYPLIDLHVDQMEAGYIDSEIPVMEEGKFAVTLSDHRCYYSEEAFLRFQERIRMINDYYAAAALVDSLLKRIESYQPLTTFDLPEKYLLLMEINRVVSLIGEYDFEEVLELKEHDPADFSRKFLRLDKFSRSATMTFEQQIMEPSSIPWENDLPTLSLEFVSRLIPYIRNSMLLNGTAGGIYNQYLTSWFDQKGFQEEEEVFYGLLRKMFPSDNLTVKMKEVAQDVWDSYLQNVRDMIARNDYVGAIRLLDHADGFRERLPFPLCPGSDLLRGEAVKGIYASYLGIAESCIALEKYAKAEDYLDQAREYLAEYRDVIPADTMFKRVFRNLFDHRLQECDGLLGEKRYTEALDCYQLFSQSYPPEMIAYVEEHLMMRKNQALKGIFLLELDGTLEGIERREIDSAMVHYDLARHYAGMLSGDRETGKAMDELEQVFLPVLYRYLADRGTYLNMTYNHEEAFRTFTRMKEIGKEIGAPLDTALDRRYRESYKYHMLNEISMATGLIWRDELERAEEYAREVETVMDLYNLDADPDLRSALTSYRDKIDRKGCHTVNEEAEQLAIRAWKNIELKQFDLAVRLLGDARKKSLQHPGCAIDLQAYDDTIKKYLSAAFYQEKQRQATNLDAIGDYRNALEIVTENERFYLMNHLDRFGVRLITPVDFVGVSDKVPMYREAISWFLDLKDPGSAWYCLKRLKQAGADQRSTREFQERVGMALAEQDAGLFAGSDPEIRVRGYTGGNRWFAKFAQAYLIRWKQLQ